MFPSGNDVRVCKYFTDNCPVCRRPAVMGLYEKSELMGIFRSNRRYHVMCQDCKSLYQIPDARRRLIYRTLGERLFGPRLPEGGQS